MALATILQRYTPVLCDKSVVSGGGEMYTGCACVGVRACVFVHVCV